MADRKPDDWQPITAQFEWPESPIEDYLPFVLANERKGTSGALSVSDKPDGMPASYQEHAAECLDKMGYKYDPTKWRYWVGIGRSGTEGRLPGFSHNFPHCHQWHGLTLVHIVQEPESGGDLVVLEDNQKVEIERFPPVLRTTSVIDGWTYHGVATIFGDTDRLTLIATAFP